MVVQVVPDELWVWEMKAEMNEMLAHFLISTFFFLRVFKSQSCLYNTELG